MYTKLKAFISIALIALPLFIIPASVFVGPQPGTGNLVVTLQPTIAYAVDANCGWSNLTACVPSVFETILFWPAYLLLKISGMFFDFFMHYSISSATYAQGVDFVTRGWALVRDIANIFFIFVLLYIAIGTILNLASVNTKKMLVKVVLIALLINFSLFFTRIIIDASNILAHAFIGSIDIQVTDTKGNPVEKDYAQISASIVEKFNPQTLIDKEEGGILAQIYSESSLAGLGSNMIIIFIGAAIMLTTSYAFIMVGLMLLGRVIELWYLMIISPIAFISIVLPFSIPQFGWSAWFKNLISTAFLAPVFMFFMYLMIMFFDIGFNSGFASNTTSTEKLLQIIIPFIITLVLVLKSKSIAQKMSGEVGAVVSKVGGAALGLAAAAATGGTAMLATRTLGAAGAKMATSGGSGFSGRMMRAAGSKMQSGSMDWRQTKAGGKIMQEMGMNSFGMGGRFTGGPGGYQGRKERYEENRTKDAAAYTQGQTKPEKKALQDVEDQMTEFNELFGDELKGLQDKIVEARTALQDHNQKEPPKPTVPRNKKNKAIWDDYDSKIKKHQSEKDKLNDGPGGLKDAQNALKTFKSTPKGGLPSYDSLEKNTDTAKKNLTKKTISSRKEYADSIEKESFTFQSKGTKESLAKKVRFNRKSNKTE